MEVVKPVTSIKTLLRTMCKRGLPDEYVMAWFVPEPEVAYEIRYEAENYKFPVKPVIIIKLESTYSDGKFMYREVIKYDLRTGNKVRRTKGNLQDFIGKKIFRTQCRYHVSNFFIEFPHWVVNNSQHASKIASAFGVSLVKLTEE